MTNRAFPLLALVLALPAARTEAQPAERPFGTLREQAAMQQQWLQKRLDTFLPAAHAQARHRHVGRADARVQRGPGLLRDHRARDVRRAAPHDLRVLRQVRRRGPPPTAACVERIALGGTSQGGVFEARRSMKAGGRRRRTRPAGGALGRRAVAGAESRDRGTQSAGDRHQSLDGVRLLRRSVERRAPGNERRAWREMDGAVQGRRRAAARPDRVAAARGGSVLHTHAGARVVDDAGNVLVEGDHPGHDEDERSRLVVAPAGERPRPRHLVPAERRRAAARARPRSSLETIRSSSAATSCTATSASPSRG